MIDTDRFWSSVNKTEGCWLWTGPSIRGYGRFSSKGNTLAAHRVAYELLVGPIPEGLQLDHLCRVHECVNPDHLEAVTARENTLRGNTLSAENAAKTHCYMGHEFSPENTLMTRYYRRDGSFLGTHRTCRACAARKRRKENHNEKHGPDTKLRLPCEFCPPSQPVARTLAAARAAATEDTPKPERLSLGGPHGPEGNEGYCRCGFFVGHYDDPTERWTEHLRAAAAEDTEEGIGKPRHKGGPYNDQGILL